METTPANERISKLLVHYIFLFPLFVGAVVVFGKVPHEFPWAASKMPLAVGMLVASFGTVITSRFLAKKPKTNLRDARMMLLIQAALGEVCAIFAVIFYVMTGDTEIPWCFMGIWAIHYAFAIRALAAPTPPGK